MDLQDEVLDDVLRRVPPQRLAACRRVCRLARRHRRPRSGARAPRAGPVRGMFVNYTDTRMHGFFCAAVAVGSLLFLPNTPANYFSRRSRIRDHCNGLLLYQNNKATYVCNPATRRWATLPLHPAAGPRFYPDRFHLVFDPTVSPHYRVMFFPEVPGKPTPPPPHRSDLPRKKPRYMSSYVCMGSESDYIESLPSPLRARYEQEVESWGSMEWPPC
ncbi:hypothetical protein ACQ4PT_028529 [Festuca glaucescens]